MLYNSHYNVRMLFTRLCVRLVLFVLLFLLLSRRLFTLILFVKQSKLTFAFFYRLQQNAHTQCHASTIADSDRSQMLWSNAVCATRAIQMFKVEKKIAHSSQQLELSYHKWQTMTSRKKINKTFSSLFTTTISHTRSRTKRKLLWKNLFPFQLCCRIEMLTKQIKKSSKRFDLLRIQSVVIQFQPIYMSKRYLRKNAHTDKRFNVLQLHFRRVIHLDPSRKNWFQPSI